MASLLAPALGRTGPRVEEIAATERREALPCASDCRRSGNQAAAVDLRCAFRRSASLFSCRGRFTEPTFTRRDLRAAMALARKRSDVSARNDGRGIRRYHAGATGGAPAMLRCLPIVLAVLGSPIIPAAAQDASRGSECLAMANA